MIASKELQQNPNLYVFLPILYTVWSDSILTTHEISTLKDMILEQEWLSEEEKEFLNKRLDPGAHPSPDEFKQWFKKIQQVIDTDDIHNRNRLADIGVKLARVHNGDVLTEKLVQAQASLQQLEEKLGLIQNESVFRFKPERRKTITQEQTTHHQFNVDALAAILDGEHAKIIHEVKSVLSRPAFTYAPLSTSCSDYREQVLKWCQLLANEGYGAMAYPKAYGGSDDMSAYFAIMETLSYHDLSMVIKYGVQFGLFGMSVYFLGTEKHHKKYLKDIGMLTLPGCFAMTETGHGSNVRGIETTATYRHADRSFIIHTPHQNAQKEYIGNAACHGEMATVFAKLIIDGKDYGVNAFLVPLRDKTKKLLAGVHIEDCGIKMGLNGVDNGKIIFSEVVIPYDNMLDRFAQVTEDGIFTSPITSDNKRFFTMLGTLVGGRIGIPRSGLSASKSGIAIAIRYGDKRRQFGPEGGAEVPILNYRTHQRRLIPLLANAYAIHFSLQYLTNRFLNRKDEEMQEIEALAAGLKAFATWNTTATLQECRECCGGKGYMSENRIDALKNDTDVFTTFEGDNTVLMQLVAKSRLTEFKQEFGTMNLFSIINYVADQAKTSLTEMNPLIVRNTDEAHLLDFEFQLNAFKYRERSILASAARRLKRHIDEGMDSFDAFNVCQHHLVQTGHAYIERIVLEQFILQVESTKDEGCKRILTKLCQLFALSQMDLNKGWYLESGYMEGVKTKAIRKLVNQLCWDIRQDAVPLVDAFKIPETCLAAPIAFDNT
ncbi:MAG TPA: acyl-CoA dehydrogenase [Ohtaekwangia sp.]|nr:acyl-CoA dehydrogenase [Ohtaekwangia sp.]